MPDARVRRQRPVRMLLKRSKSGNHGDVLNGYAGKALCWPDGGCMGQGRTCPTLDLSVPVTDLAIAVTKVWGTVTEERLTPSRYKAGAPADGATIAAPTSRRSSGDAPASTASQRPSLVQRQSSQSDAYGTDRSASENHWDNEQSRKRAQNPPSGAEGIIMQLPCDDQRLNGQELHGYIANGVFKGRMPEVGVKHRSHFRGILKRSASGNHNIVLDGMAQKALSWPDSKGGWVGEKCAFLVLLTAACNADFAAL